MPKPIQLPKQTPWTKQLIAVAVDNTGLVYANVTAEVNGPVAIHRPHRDAQSSNWSVTHNATGFEMALCRDEEQARLVAEAILNHWMLACLAINSRYAANQTTPSEVYKLRQYCLAVDKVGQYIDPTPYL